jgi:putative hydrolase of the HAD superfamily
MTEKYRTILLDVNGTLLGYEDPWGFEKRFAAGIADYGIHAEPEDVRAAIRPLADQFIALKNSGKRASSDDQYRLTFTWFYRSLLEALDKQNTSTEFGSYQDIAERLYDRFIYKEGFMPPYNEVPGILKQLKERGLRLGILSNYPTLLEDVLRRHGIHQYFDFFVVSSVVGLEKPDPAIFDLAIQQAGCVPEQILYVGDDPDDDLRGARKAGLEMILIDRLDRMASVDCPRINRLSDLLRYL